MPKADKYTGLNQGLPDHRGLDEEGKQLLEDKLNRDYAPNVVGNFADLQKAGAPGGPDTIGEVAAESPVFQEAEEAEKASKSSKSTKKK